LGLQPGVQDHENRPPAHRSTFLAWKELERGLNKSGLIDDHLQQQIAKAAKTWREILERITATVQTLTQQNLPLRGHRESLVSDPNPVNFLALLKCLAKSDTLMREHLDSISGKPGCLSYFSPDTQNESINLLGARVRQTITSSIQKTKYYSIIFDTTPDKAHIKQMSQIVKFVEIQRDPVEIKEAFIDFIPLDVKTAEIITAQITKKLERDGLILEDCRGQSYDNQATMADIHSDVRKRILDLNPLADCVPCNNHSLSLVGVHAARVNVQELTLFGTV
jgi:hypothetical protein